MFVILVALCKINSMWIILYKNKSYYISQLILFFEFIKQFTILKDLRGTKLLYFVNHVEIV